ncbi:Multicopper oxidase with three cupredoxin domains (includes cell division protein FtsP and spore coat protein CotA) [Roseovarius azorensis]|uniref:Multicopper oxidase with three cupredoxin domains (Includes cell division protein FtsP and spore coat protein CotA) n=1 Tax=Roseovarius azorensis TaxID=1287727 RepID=A0A1H7UAB5_9RHOB|nr:multicopper oxidase family protein [Roseovarius azorensis]SEL93227.1 Multicopper oxidase with three cupredoxin domains (includes cell division protein FtsP and spore coat protein CotA) [Roseovarius azorensis]
MSQNFSRRAFLSTTAAAAALPLVPALATGQVAYGLRAAPGRARLVPEPWGETPVWCYDGAVPGPVLRAPQGARLSVAVQNGLATDTTVHWHGLRLPNAMDGVPHLTQPPIRPGETFAYEFDLPDAGTFWYHPHMQSAEQVGRGLYGALIVEEAAPPRVDRDVIWVLDDWRLTQEAAISADFGANHDQSHAGRIGNTVTINGRVPDEFALRPGERIRLRLINAANARIFELDFGDLDPRIIALDGQPVTPHSPEAGLVTLGPAMRADLILDMPGAPDARISVTDGFYPQAAYRLVDLVAEGAPLRDGPPDWPIALAPNPLPEPDLSGAIRHEITFTGGAMGGMVMQGMGLQMDHRGNGFWFVNGVAAEGHVHDPILTLRRDASHVLRMTNATGFHHPIHLHGHSFRVLSRNGIATPHREWRDTVLMAPREQVEIGFVADNPGDWMIHCHILEHQAAGMMAVLRVA